MPSIFSRLKGRDGGAGKTKNKKSAYDTQTEHVAPKKLWDDAWTRSSVEPEEIHELVKRCTEELKSRALDLPFLLLPFRPTSDPSAVRTFVRNYFDNNALRGDALVQDLRMAEPIVVAGVVKWCWSRQQGGVVGWDAYELFKVGEQDSNMARDSFKTFIPLSVENGARSSIIFDFFDLMTAISAHGKTNGFGGKKLSRMASWWAFEHKETGEGFEGGYKKWLSAADATSHLFFAYLRSIAPQQPTRGGISLLPMSLQKLMQETEYPPQPPAIVLAPSSKVVMIVDTVSPTPFALLRRGSHFQYRDDDRALQQFSEYEDPVQALTEECRRVLKAVSAANQTQAVSSSKHSTSLRDASWSRFEDIGFTTTIAEDDEESDIQTPRRQGLRTTPASTSNLGRPTTPSWADFMSSGFVEDNNNSNHLLPPDKVLPRIDTTVRQRSAQSHRPRLESDSQVEPGELASIRKLDLDDSFWWVWMSSLAPEETPERKATFGRCAVIETVIRNGRWIVMEEMVQGAVAEPPQGAYVAEKKGLFSWTRRNRENSRRRSTADKPLAQSVNHHLKNGSMAGFSKTSVGPDQQAKIQAAAQQLQLKQEREKAEKQQAANQTSPPRRGRSDADLMAEKTNSVMTLQPVIMSEASPAMKWAHKYDKDVIREKYLGSAFTGRGESQQSLPLGSNPHGNGDGLRPSVPDKESSPSPSPYVTAAVPNDKHLGYMNGNGNVSRSESPLPPPPRRESPSVEIPRESMASPEPTNGAYDGKAQKKLHKEKPPSSGLKKLFGRNKRSSKLPDNAGAEVNGMLSRQQTNDTTADARPITPPHAAATQSKSAPIAENSAIAARQAKAEEARQAQAQVAATPTHSVTAAGPEPRHAGPVVNTTGPQDESRVNTADASLARDEFSRFDQGPLEDQPAFVSGHEHHQHNQDEEDDEVEEALPPPISRTRNMPEEKEERVLSPVEQHPARTGSVPAPPLQQQQQQHIQSQPQPQRIERKAAPAPIAVASAATASPPAAAAAAPAAPPTDRWAQIRKNAAERAAAQKSAGVASPAAAASPTAQTNGARKADEAGGVDDGSGEETIESRVARIKARVAELTNNIDNKDDDQLAQH